MVCEVTGVRSRDRWPEGRRSGPRTHTQADTLGTWPGPLHQPMPALVMLATTAACHRPPTDSSEPNPPNHARTRDLGLGDPTGPDLALNTLEQGSSRSESSRRIHLLCANQSPRPYSVLEGRQRGRRIGALVHVATPSSHRGRRCRRCCGRRHGTATTDRRTGSQPGQGREGRGEPRAAALR